MSGLGEVAVVVYAATALILLFTGLADYFGVGGWTEKKGGARRALAAPVWPIVLIVAIVAGLIRLIGDLWKAAYIK